jgi:glucosamine--fructose-6-phosphate aminotransferase (isomerizing)
MLPLADRLTAFARGVDLGRLAQRIAREVPPQWETALPASAASRLDRLVISGCGDSLFAGLAARLAIERFGAIPCEPLDALECGRYASVRFGPGVGVLAISNSGTTSRVVESAALARRRGALVLSLTGAPDAVPEAALATTPLEEAAAGRVRRPVDGAGDRDGPTARLERHLGEYLGTLLALYHLAFHLGESRGVMTREQRRREAEALDCAVGDAVTALTTSPRPVAEALSALADADRIFYLGAGPAYGTARFGAAKLLEEVPLAGVPEHLEEWAHLQYFLTMVEHSRTRVVVLAPPGESTDRAVEVLHAIRDDGGVAVTVTHPAERRVAAAAARAITVETSCWEGYAPLPYGVVVQLLGVALAFRRGRREVPLARGDGGRLIRASGVRT